MSKLTTCHCQSFHPPGVLSLERKLQLFLILFRYSLLLHHQGYGVHWQQVKCVALFVACAERKKKVS